ncbi:MAG: spore cortex-lytic enzyme [Intestinimonas sp.]|jgi:N-acetylmuramoyl-L-alanine amidase|nr:spore cortex-lytic enzyme [Intestinimonas sp.]
MSKTEKRRKLLVALGLIFALNIFLIIGLTQTAQAAAYRPGSTGDTVRTIQTKLKNWGYYEGNVDGIYGSRTTEAVRYFQRENSLTEDGIAGPATLAALGIQDGSTTNTGGIQAQQNGSLQLLARVVSAEARGEPYSGQVAVGAVILNRVGHPSFPNTIAGVVYQPGAFTCMMDGQFNAPVSDSAIRAAQAALNGADPSGGAIYYFNPATATSGWIWSRPLLKIIGNHRFCA